MNQKTKKTLVIGAFAFLFVDRIGLAHEIVTLKRQNKNLIADNKQLRRHAKFYFRFTNSLIPKLRPEEIDSAMTDLEFFDMTT